MDEKKTGKCDALREKSTFSLSVSTKESLEDGWLQLRRMFRGQCVCKSTIVEEAVKVILEDLEKNKESSKICKILSKNKKF